MSLEGGNYEEPIKKPILADAASDMAKKIQSQNPEAEKDGTKKLPNDSDSQKSEGLADGTEAKNALKLTPDQQQSADTNALQAKEYRIQGLNEALSSQKGANQILRNPDIGWA